MTLGSIKRRMHSVLFRMPLMITCQQFEAFIVDYLEGGLTTRERRRFNRHLRVCQGCRAYLAAYEASIEAAKKGLAEPARPEFDDAPEDLVMAIVKSIAAHKTNDTSPDGS